MEALRRVLAIIQKCNFERELEGRAWGWNFGMGIAGKEGAIEGANKKAAGSGSEKTRRRRSPKEGFNAKQGPVKGSPSKPAEPEGE